jgi:hypothetical protein
MLDLNHRSPNEKLNALVDAAIVAHRAAQSPRNYLGGSRLGVECDRALQFEFFNTPKDSGKDFPGRVLRIFDFGHCLEDLTIKWLRMAGFDLRTQKPDGSQFGFSVAGDRIAGHIDGVLCGGPDLIKYPCLWENKSMNCKEWKKTAKEGVAKAHPEYAAQIAIYQAYMNLDENPALFTAENKDTAEILFELVPFNAGLAQKCSDRGVRILQACDAGEVLPRIASSSDFYLCKWCEWSDRCWQMNV